MDIALILIAVVVVGFFSAAGLNMWAESDGAKERRRVKHVQNTILLQRLQKESELELMLKQWQATKSLEDLERHRLRIEENLDAQFGIKPAEESGS